MSRLEIVQQNYASFGRGDIPSIVASMSPEVEWLARYPREVPFAGTHRGHHGIAALFQSIGGALEVLRFAIARFHDAGQVILVEGEEEVRVRATGKTYVNPWIHLWEFDAAGKIVRVSNYNDSAAARDGFAG